MTTPIKPDQEALRIEEQGCFIIAALAPLGIGLFDAYGWCLVVKQYSEHRSLGLQAQADALEQRACLWFILAAILVLNSIRRAK